MQGTGGLVKASSLSNELLDRPFVFREALILSENHISGRHSTDLNNSIQDAYDMRWIEGLVIAFLH